MKRAAPTGAIADRPTAPKRPRPRPRPRPALAPGVHLLAHQATLTYVPGAVPCARPEFDALFDAQPPPTPNPMNAKTFLRRRQGTFGATYRFGRQTSVNMGPVDAAPDVVRRCVDDARRRAGPDHAPKYTGAHVNWYPDGAAGLKAHQDATDPGPGAQDGTPVLACTDPILARDRLKVAADCLEEVANASSLAVEEAFEADVLLLHALHAVAERPANLAEHHRRQDLANEVDGSALREAAGRAHVLQGLAVLARLRAPGA